LLTPFKKIDSRGEYKLEEWNSEFWKLKEEIVGVKAPVDRTSEDLDPPSIFHICQDFDMIRCSATAFLHPYSKPELS
jgi:hypothetical protein